MAEARAKKKIALITGASSGLGAEFALQIEKSAFLDEIWLVARRKEPMKDLAEKFRKSRPVIIALDLTDRGDISALTKRIQDENPEIAFLVNNAGYGKIGPFQSLGLEEQAQMIDLNVRALTHLTHAALPYMTRGSRILQVASSIGFCPAPYFAVYAATKAYVVSFSEALREELKGNGIGVTAVCPGPVATEFFTVAQKNDFMKDKLGQSEPFNKSLTASAAEVVEKALNDASHNRRRSIFGLPIQLFVFFLPFLPHHLVMRALSGRSPR